MTDARTCPCGYGYRVVSLKWQKKLGWVRSKKCVCGKTIRTVEVVIETEKKRG